MTVPDASFIFHAIGRSQLLPEAVRVLTNMIESRESLDAPVLLEVEVASGLRGLEARGRITRSERDEVWQGFRLLPLRLRWQSAWVERASEIAAAAGLSKVYDALYLACAEALDAELVTCDEKFVAALPPPLRSRVRLVASSA